MCQSGGSWADIELEVNNVDIYVPFNWINIFIIPMESGNKRLCDGNVFIFYLSMASKDNDLKDGGVMMAYQPIDKPIPKYFNGKKVWSYKRDCKDFRPFFFDRRHCKLADNCRTNGYHCESLSSITNRWGKLCTGIKIDRWQKIIS